MVKHLPLLTFCELIEGREGPHPKARGTETKINSTDPSVNRKPKGRPKNGRVSDGGHRTPVLGSGTGGTGREQTGVETKVLNDTDRGRSVRDTNDETHTGTRVRERRRHRIVYDGTTGFPGRGNKDRPLTRQRRKNLEEYKGVLLNSVFVWT